MTMGRPVRYTHCQIDGCEGKHEAFGRCAKHYRAMRRTGGLPYAQDAVPSAHSQVITLDKKLRVLEEAKRVWTLSLRASSAERIELARDLHAYEAFSLNQLAKICRTNVPAISRRMRPNSGGGKFSPETLDSLILLRKTVLTNQPVSKYLVRITVEAGTSANTIATLTGASTSVLYKMLNAA